MFQLPDDYEYDSMDEFDAQLDKLEEARAAAAKKKGDDIQIANDDAAESEKMSEQQKQDILNKMLNDDLEQEADDMVKDVVLSISNGLEDEEKPESSISHDEAIKTLLGKKDEAADIVNQTTEMLWSQFFSDKMPEELEDIVNFVDLIQEKEHSSIKLGLEDDNYVVYDGINEEMEGCSGNDNEIKVMLSIAKLKGWDNLVLDGELEYKIAAAKAAKEAGFEVNFTKSNLDPSLVTDGDDFSKDLNKPTKHNF